MLYRPLIFFALTCSMVIPAVGQQQSLKLAMPYSLEDPGGKFALEWRVQLERRTRGEVKIEVFCCNQLGHNSLELLQVGAADIAVVPAQSLNRIHPALRAFVQPSIFDSPTVARVTFEQTWPELVTNPRGVMLLGSLHLGMRDRVPALHAILANDRAIQRQNPSSRQALTEALLSARQPIEEAALRSSPISRAAAEDPPDCGQPCRASQSNACPSAFIRQTSDDCCKKKSQGTILACPP